MMPRKLSSAGLTQVAILLGVCAVLSLEKGDGNEPKEQAAEWASRFATKRLWHNAGVTSAAFSSDGKLLASGSGDGTVQLWEVAGARVLRQLHGHQSWISALAFSLDGKLLASGDAADGIVRVWDAVTGHKLHLLQAATGRVNCLAFSPDGKLLASGSGDKIVRLWDVATGRELRQFGGHQDLVSSVAFSPDGKLLASGSGDKIVRLWDVATSRELRQFRGHRSWIEALAFSPNGKLLASGGGDRIVWLWDVATGREWRQLWGHQGWIRSLGFSPDGRLLAVAEGNDGTVRLWELATADVCCVLDGQADAVGCLAWSAEGCRLAASHDSGSLIVWQVFPETRVKEVLSDDMLKAIWFGLGGNDAARAFQAIRRLLSHPHQAVSFLEKHLQPASPIDPKRVAGWIADLDSADFATREKATQELIRLGEAAVPMLTKALPDKLSAESRRRLELVLRQIDSGLNPEELQQLRGVQVLEYIGSSEARQVLQKLALGAPGRRLTEEAIASLQRLSKQQATSRP